MKIAFVIRDSSRTKGGGDVDLAHHYKGLLDGQTLADGRVVEAEVVTASKVDPATCAFVVLFNIDMPFENLLVAEQCLAHGVPYVIYTLHPKMKYINMYLRHGTYGLQYLAALASFFKFRTFENFSTIARLHREKKLRQLLKYRLIKVCAREVLKNCVAAVVSCEAEARQLATDYYAEVRHTVIPHYFDSRNTAPEAGAAQGDDERFILCAGRIEPRKNQLAVIALAERFPSVKFLFVGRKNDNHPKYVRAFEEALERLPNMVWKDHVTLDELKRLIATASIYVNISWFEVFSLIDLMALTAGTRSVLTAGSYMPDEPEFSSRTDLLGFASPDDVDAAAERIEAFLDGGATGAPAPLAIDWSAEVVRGKWLDLIERTVRVA